MTDKTDAGEPRATGIEAPGRVDQTALPRPALTEWPRPPGGQAEGTWLDLVPPDAPVQVSVDLISRHELLERLRTDHHLRISARTLHAWEVAGALPRPVKRWRGSGSRSAPRALYPKWAVDVVSMAGTLKGWGWGVPSIRAHLLDYVPKAIDNYARGTSHGVVELLLIQALNDIAKTHRWRPDDTPAAMEVRLLNAAGGEVYAQTVGISDGAMALDGTT